MPVPDRSKKGSRTPMTIQIPIGATVVIHRAGQVDQRYIFRGGPPWQYEDPQGVIHEDPFKDGYHSVTVINPDTGLGTYYTP
jgi:hypothetical protein